MDTVIAHSAELVTMLKSLTIIGFEILNVYDVDHFITFDFLLNSNDGRTFKITGLELVHEDEGVSKYFLAAFRPGFEAILLKSLIENIELRADVSYDVVPPGIAVTNTVYDNDLSATPVVNFV